MNQVACLLTIFTCVSCFVFPSIPQNKLYAKKTLLFAVSTKVEAIEEVKKYSFVRDDLRSYAMKLHTKDQAPKEGEKKAKVPFTKWEPTLQDYLHFLVDSLKVYETLEDIVQSYPELSSFRSTGLERSQALKEDIKWICEHDSSLSLPICGEPGLKYSEFLQSIAQESIPKFMCHYYNHYFAHTAGGRMIGKRMCEKLLDNKILKFYQWEGDVKELLENVKASIDTIASNWNKEEKQECMEETLACFSYGERLMSYIRKKEEM